MANGGRPAKSGCRNTGFTLSSGVPKTKLLLVFWLPPLLWLAVIFSASADSHSYEHTASLFVPLCKWLFPRMAPEQIDRFHYLFRKCGHLTEYALLALLFWRALHRPQRHDPRPWRWDEAGLAAALVWLCAAADELHQVFVPARTALVSDVAVDTAGGVAALAVLWLARKLLKRA